MPPLLRYEDYTVAWICALKAELLAAMFMLDERHYGVFPSKYGDENQYIPGTIAGHNVIIVALPRRTTGTISAATLVGSLKANFRNVRFGLMVGIGAGVPGRNLNPDIRLGDVIVAGPGDDSNSAQGVLNYGLGKESVDGFVNIGWIQPTDRRLRTAIESLEAEAEFKGHDILAPYLARFRRSSEGMRFLYPGACNDNLYEAENIGSPGAERYELISRPVRQFEGPAIHYGLVASGDKVVKSPKLRDALRDKYGIICFEMEAAGILNTLPVAVIRGVSDYADSHKNDSWHEYAAATAASYARCLLETIGPMREDLLTIPDKPETSRRFFSVPFGRNAQFIGRKDEVDALLSKVASNNPEDDCQRVTVFGLGGMGKTQICIEFAYRLQEMLESISVFWVSAVTAETLKKDFRDIGQTLKIPGIEESDAEVHILVRTALANESFGRWLLIIDNADDSKMLYESSSDSCGEMATPLIEYLPFSRLGSIVFTTRNLEAAVKYSATNRIEVGKPNTEDAIEMLESNLGDIGTMADTDDKLQLLEILDYLPLAIMQAAAYLCAKQLSVTKYLHIYRDSSEALSEVLNRNIEDTRRYRTVSKPVATTWFISFEQIARDDPLAADYLCFMSCVNPQNIPTSLLPEASLLEVANSIGTLKAYALIKERSSGNCFDTHSLVHLSVQKWLTAKGVFHEWTGRVLERVAEVFPTGEPENVHLWNLYLHHALHILNLTERSSLLEQAGRTLLYNVGWCLLNGGLYNEAEIICRMSLQMNECAVGPDHPDTLNSMSKLGRALKQNDKPNEAETVCRHVLKLRECASGVDHLDTSSHPALNLFELLRDSGRLKEAHEMSIRTLNQMVKSLGLEHHLTLTCFSNLAQILHAQGHFDAAKGLNEQTLVARGRTLGPVHQDTLTSINNSALLPGRNNDPKEAEDMFRTLCEVCEATLGPENPLTLVTKNNLAMVLNWQGQSVEAMYLLQGVLSINTKLLGPEHCRTLTTRSNIAVVSHAQGRCAVADQLFREILLKVESLMGPEHPSTLLNLSGLAQVRQSQERYDEAAEMLTRVFEARERALGLDNPDTLASARALHHLQVIRQQLPR